MLKLKPIKPKADPLNVAAIERTVKAVMQEAADDAKSDLEKTTEGWQHGVSFEAIPDKTGFIVGTADEVWNYLDQGTKAHEIRPRRATRLRFQTGYKAKTRPRVLASGGGGASGDVVYAKSVQHPGTEAREWSETVAEKYQTEIPFRMNEAIGGVTGRD